jgi:hypothetical protein
MFTWNLIFSTFLLDNPLFGWSYFFTVTVIEPSNWSVKECFFSCFLEAERESNDELTV